MIRDAARWSRMNSFLRAFAAGELSNYSALVFDRYIKP
jgi:hypothetical protein